MAIATLGFKVDSKDARKAAKDLDHLDKKAVAATAAAKSLGKAAGLAGLAIAAAFSGGAIVRGISEFDSSMARLAAVSRATSSELMVMRDVAKELGSTTEFSASQAAGGLNFLAMAGFNATEAVASLPAVLDLATASGMGLAQAADEVSNIMSTFGVAAANTSDVTDVLAGASSRANTSVSELAQAVTSVGSVAAGMGLDLVDTSAALAVLADLGIKGARAGTSLRGVLASLAGPTTQAQDALSKYGITVDDINPELTSLEGVMTLMGRANISTADAFTIFGREAAGAFTILSNNADKFSELGLQFSNLDGSARDAADTIRDNLGGDIKSAISAAEGLILALGDAGVTLVLRGLFQGITSTTRAITGLIDKFSDARESLTSFVKLTFDSSVAIDNVTLSMGDEISQANKLFALMGEGNTMTQSAALVKLSEAEAHIRNADALRSETQAILSMQIATLELRRISASEALRSIAAPGTDLEDMSRNVRDAYEELEQSLVGIINEQSRLNDLANHGNAEFKAAADEVDRIRTAIAGAVDGMVVFDGKLVTANSLSERLSSTVGGITFDKANEGVSDLAERLGVSLAIAMQIAAISGTTNIGDEVFDPRSQHFNKSARDAANRKAILDEIRASFANIDVNSGIELGGGGGGSDQNNQLERSKQIIESLKTETQKYNEELADLKELQEMGYLSTEQLTEAQKLLRNEFEKDHFKEQRDVIDSFSAALLKGEDGIRSFFRTLVAQAAQSMLSSGIQSLLGIGGGPSRGGVLGGIGKIFAGFFDAGGNIPSGQIGIAGENGPEIIKGPANVTSTRDTARMLNSGSQDVNVTVSIDENGNLQAFVDRRATQVIAGAAPSIVRESVNATSRQMQSSKQGFF